MKKPEIVSMVKVDGIWFRQEELQPEEYQKLLEIKINETMRNIGFERIKTA